MSSERAVNSPDAMNLEIDRLAHVRSQRNHRRIETFEVSDLKNCVALFGGVESSDRLLQAFARSVFQRGRECRLRAARTRSRSELQSAQRRLAASIWPIRSRQLVVQSVFLSLLIVRAVSSLRSQTATNCDEPSAARVCVNACVLPAETADSDDCCA